jgi:AAA family ATP:ADP antiporter
MRDRLFKLLGIESGEESMVSMLLAQSVFLGIFFGAFDISAHSLFLSIFDEKMMARGYVVSGMAGIILTSLYTGLQTRMRFRNFAILNLVFVTSITLLLWILLLINPAKWVIFIVFIMLGPLNILAMLGFWGTTGRLFTLRQGKRLFGLIDVGMVVGIILSCYAIPVLLTFSFKAHNILIISAAAVMTGSILQIIIGRRFQLAAGRDEEEKETKEKKRSVVTLVRSDSYIRIMAIFIALSVMTAFFVQYSFMAVTREQYPSEDDMARFLGLFTGSMMIFTLLIKLLVFSYLIKNYGLRTCLAVSSILVAAFTLIAILIGMLMGFTPATSGFMLFFMLLALSRLFSKSLKDSIESPSFKVIYQTLDEKIRYEVQSSMDGTVNEIAALSSGLILAGLGIVSFIKLIHFSWVLFAITIVWIFMAVRLYSEYRMSIRKALESGREGAPGDVLQPEQIVLKSRLSAEQVFSDNYLSLISGDFKCFETYRNRNFLERILDYSESRKDISLLPSLNRIASNKNIDEEIRQRSVQIADDLQRYSSEQQSEDKLFLAKKILADSRQPQTTQILRLLRDNTIESKELAILMIGKFRLKDMLPEVCECLGIKGLEMQAANVLRSFGDEAREDLGRFFMTASGNNAVSKTILKLMGENCSNENQEFLFSRLWSNSRLLRETALENLIKCNYRVTEEDKDRLHQLISEVIGIIVWNISARVTIARKNDTSLLEPLNGETARWNRFLFRLLSIAYDSGSVEKIRENLDSGTVESVNFALEMIDIVIDEAIKPKLVPLLDVIPDEDKVKALYQFYPGEIHEYGKLIEDLINRDYNLLGIWIRACAIRSLNDIENENIGESLVALLFSPEKILQEESARMLSRYDKELYKSASSRISAGKRDQLDAIINGERAEGELLYEKVRFLSECFPGLSKEDLLLPAETMKHVKDVQSADLDLPGGYILWQVHSGKPGKEVRITSEPLGTKETKTFRDSCDFLYLLPLNTIKEFNFRFPEKSQEIMEYIESNET